MEGMMEADFDGVDQKLIRYLADNYLANPPLGTNHDLLITVSQLADHFGIELKRVQQKLQRFEDFQFLKVLGKGRRPSGQYIKPTDKILSIAEQLDRPPPPRDLLAEVMTWAKSKWWIVAVLLIGFIGPWALGVISGAKIILEWFGISQSP